MNMFPLLLGAGALALVVATKKKGNGAKATGPMVETGIVASGAQRNKIGIWAEWQVVGLAASVPGFAPGQPTLFNAEMKLMRDPEFTTVSEHGSQAEAIDAAQTALISQGFTELCPAGEEVVENPPGSGQFHCVPKVKPTGGG